MTFLGQLAYPRLVTAKGQPFVETGVELALEFAQGPVLAGGLDFIEAALVGILDAQEENVVRPAQREGTFSR